MTDDEFRDLQRDQIMMNIEKMRADMVLDQQTREDDRMAREAAAKWEMRRFVVSLLVAIAATAGAAGALGNYLGSRPLPAPQPIVIHIERAP